MLINKIMTLVAAAAADSNEPRLPLRNVHLTDEYVEATDGHILFRVWRSSANEDDYPRLRSLGDDQQGDPITDVLLPAQAFAGLAKQISSKVKNLPILTHGRLIFDKQDGQVVWAATDLDHEVSQNILCSDEQYPNVHGVIPKRNEQTLTIKLDPNLLIKVATFMAQARDDRGVAPSLDMEIQLDALAGPIVFKTVGINTVQKALAVLMPRRITEGVNMHGEPLFMSMRQPDVQDRPIKSVHDVRDKLDLIGKLVKQITDGHGVHKLTGNPDLENRFDAQMTVVATAVKEALAIL
jgi:hypothetical protein